MSWIGQAGDKMITILNILPKDSTIERGLHFYTYIDRLATYFHSEKQELLKYFPQDIDKSKTLYGNLPTVFGYFKNIEEIKNFSNGLKLKKNLK